MTTPGRSHGIPKGMTFVELLVGMAIVATLASVAAVGYSHVRTYARSATSSNNLRQLVAANVAFAADHGGRFCPTWDMQNNVRWHGGRNSSAGGFVVSEGFLGDYLQSEKAVHCPLFADYVSRSPENEESEMTFEDGAGGYGYNDEYLGSEPGKSSRIRFAFKGRSLRLFSLGSRNSRIPHPSRTVMFTTSALARDSGLQEYPISHPRHAVRADGSYGYAYQPSVHFRANGKALVAWCDGHVTAEAPDRSGAGEDHNVYGGDNSDADIGFFGPSEDNGYWNPRYHELHPRR